MRTAWRDRYRGKVTTAAEAVGCVMRGSRVFVGSGCAEPTALVEALVGNEELADVEIVHIMTVGGAPYAEASRRGRFRHNAFFIGANVREAIAMGEADYTPVFLSEIPTLFRSRRMKLDVAMVTVSPPDRHGFCSLGVSIDVVKAAVETARVVVAEVTPSMPRTHGASFVHADDLDVVVESGRPLLELPPGAPDDISTQIGRLCAELVPDGATLQMGIGDIPNAVLANLTERHDLGLHTEMLSDGVIPLIEAGVITCMRKTLHPGKAVTSFCMGTRRLYDFVDDNPFFEFLPTEFVNDPFVIARNERMISINSALQVDLTGQVCADSIGTRFYSGIGGQVDFIRGAKRSPGGRSILAFPSTAKGGALSRIVPVLSEGAGVVTTRGDVDRVVTEYGVAELEGRSVRERALALVSIAHPDHRGDLLAAAKGRKLVTAGELPWPEGGRPFPVELQWSERFGDTEIRFRPVRPTDERLLREFFYSHSATTVRHRYRAPLKTLPREQIQAYCTPDYDAHMAIAGFVPEGDGERMVAIARYQRDRATGLGEVAFTVHDELQGRGIGTHLFRRLMEIGRDRGLKGFTGYVLAGNERMMGIFHACGAPVETEREGDVYRVTVRFPDAAADRRNA